MPPFLSGIQDLDDLCLISAHFIESVGDFQVTFLSKMRAFHAADVLEPLAAGVINDEIASIIEKEAASIVNGLL